MKAIVRFEGGVTVDVDVKNLSEKEKNEKIMKAFIGIVLRNPSVVAESAIPADILYVPMENKEEE